MDKLNFVTNGLVTRLPPGFRFQPTDEELLFQYLRRKVFSCPLPASIIPEINIFNYDPWDLPGDLDQERYFFSNTEAKYRNGKRSKRTTKSGHWKVTGSDKKIKCSRWNINDDDMIGNKKTLIFYRGKSPHGTRTDWIMHKYSLVISTESKTCSHDDQEQIMSLNQKENWVLYRIFMKKRKTEISEDGIIIQNYNYYSENKAENVGSDQPSTLNFTNLGWKTTTTTTTTTCPAVSCFSSSSSSSSSSITDVSSSEAQQEGNSAACYFH